MTQTLSEIIACNHYKYMCSKILISFIIFTKWIYFESFYFMHEFILHTL